MTRSITIVETPAEGLYAAHVAMHTQGFSQGQDRELLTLLEKAIIGLRERTGQAGATVVSVKSTPPQRG